MHYALTDFLLDLVQNSVEAGAKTVWVSVVADGGLVSARVRDDGKGMDEATKAKAMDPFWTDGTKHRRRRVGLGIPFLIQSLELAGGSWKLDSEPGRGTEWSFGFPADGLDTPPLGDIPGFAISAMSFEGDYEFRLERREPARGIDYAVSRSELAETLGGLDDAGALVLARAYLESHEGPGDDNENEE